MGNRQGAMGKYLLRLWIYLFPTCHDARQVCLTPISYRLWFIAWVYDSLSASTIFIREARIAGRTPPTNPIISENASAM